VRAVRSCVYARPAARLTRLGLPGTFRDFRVAERKIEASQGVAVWPRRLPDPFPEADGVVEVAAAGLNSDLVGGAILHHGCILVRGLLPPSTIEQLIDDVDAAFEAYEKWVRRAEDGAVDDAIGLPWFEPFVLDRRYDTGRIAFSRMIRDHHRVLLADSPPALFDVLEAFDATGVQDIVGGLPRRTTSPCT
jgi:hypothetical protein